MDKFGPDALTYYSQGLAIYPRYPGLLKWFSIRLSNTVIITMDHTEKELNDHRRFLFIIFILFSLIKRIKPRCDFGQYQFSPVAAPYVWSWLFVTREDDCFVADAAQVQYPYGHASFVGSFN